MVKLKEYFRRVSPSSLVLGIEDAARLLVQPLVVPAAVEALELSGDPVVLAHEERVDHGERGLLVHPLVACGQYRATSLV